MSSSAAAALPQIIQGGMGVGVSNWVLAGRVAACGQLGVVSGTAVERVLACRLQAGDPDGAMRRALAAFPDQAVASRILNAWFRPEGLPAPGEYKPVPLFSQTPSRALLELTVCGSFVEVWLAKQQAQDGGAVGINLLEKIRLPTLPTLYGALLAGVDAVLMGAGIPREIPAHITRLSAHEASSLRIPVEGGDTVESRFDPADLLTVKPTITRPAFLAVISSDVLAVSLARSGGIDGFIVEGPTAGGHNAPPRGGAADAKGTPIYGPRDVPDLKRIAALNLPFWLAGGKATHEAFREALATGAHGVQIGTAFAFCEESAMIPEVRAMARSQPGGAPVVTDGRASPTGFPFKVVAAAGSEGGRDPDLRERRTCTLGYLREAYAREDQTVGWRCPSEPVEQWSAKGGDPTAATGRRCVCNGLMATIGHPHANRDGSLELPLITAGDDLVGIDRFGKRYHADEVIDLVLGRVTHAVV